MNILEFAESIEMPLFPVQKVILKALYGLELSTEKTLEISDHTRRHVRTTGVRHRNPNSHASVILRSKTQYSQSFRGLSSFLVLFDEIAHYDKSKVESLYNTVVPSTSAFCPKDSADKRKSVGPVESKVMMISTPTPCRDSFFYRIFQMGMIFSLRHPDSGDLCLQIPTWEMNPTLPAEVFAQDRAKDHSRFDYEYGAQFPK